LGEWTAWYIPERQEELAGKLDEAADRLWEKGVPVWMSDQQHAAKNRELQDKGITAPPWDHAFSHESIGLSDEEIYIPIPYNVYDASCPTCGAEVYQEFCDAMDDVLYDEPNSQHEGLDLRERVVRCPKCAHAFKTSEAEARETGFAFARVYLWVSDIAPEDDWEPSFRATVESVLGPCREIIAWDT
jgi:hypothetical protein